MKINDNVNVGKLNQSTQQQPVEGTRSEETSGAKGQAGDSSRVSSLARQIAEARRVADGLPDVRADKIVLARERLASGFYDTPEAKEALVDKLVALVNDQSS